MTAPAAAWTGFDWEDEGRQLGESLDEYHAIVVIGTDSTIAAHVALGIGRAQSARRRVAIADLVGEAPPLQALVTTEDPHGIVDSFQYGVSLNRIAYPVDGSGQLFIMPSGSEPPDHAEILPNPRWRRLAAGFREVGALLILVVPAGAPGIEDLVTVTNGAILVGSEVPSQLPAAFVIASVREPRLAPASTRRGIAPRAELPPAAEATGKRFSTTAIVGVGLTVLLAATALWLAARPLSHSFAPLWKNRGAHETLAGKILGPGVESAGRPATAGRDSMAAVAPSPIPVVVNRADSAGAASYAVELMAANTQAGAILKLQRDGKNLPAATFAPVLSRGERWYKVFAGAYRDRAEADSLMSDLRRRGLLDARAGVVVQVPYAFLIDSGVPAAAAPNMVATYADRGQPVYALRQPNGAVWLYAGAFEFPEQAVSYAESLKAAGIIPVLVYRKGRVF